MKNLIAWRNLFFLLLLHFGWTTGFAYAWSEKALDASGSFVFTPNNLNTDFFYLDTKYPYSFIPKSFEWVRVDHRMVVPRAKLKLTLPVGTQVLYQGRMSVSVSGTVELLVVLTQEKGNVLEIAQQKIPIRFRVPHAINPKLVVDSSCSNAPIQFKDQKLAHSWVFVFCHTIQTRGTEGAEPELDIQVLWENQKADAESKLNGFPFLSFDGISSSFSLNASSAPLFLEKGEDSFRIEPQVAKRFKALGVSLGIGPYYNQNILRAFATLYASYFFNEQLKLASFTAMPLRSSPEVDQGFYLITEQFRGLDERLVMNLLLGVHALYFTADKSYFKFSAPQGLELSFRDLFAKTYSGSMGVFFYPEISGRSYVNTWVRYGNPHLFGELNYLSWKEVVDTGSFSSKSFGLSVGFPLFRAF